MREPLLDPNDPDDVEFLKQLERDRQAARDDVDLDFSAHQENEIGKSRVTMINRW